MTMKAKFNFTYVFTCILAISFLSANSAYAVDEKSARSFETFIEPATGIELVFVRGGCFAMGNSFGDGTVFERPLHEVCVDDFYLGKYELTEKQWRLVMGNVANRNFHGDQHPVQNININEVRAFIEKLAIISSKPFRLPTEAEWEYAARDWGIKKKWAGAGNETELADYVWYQNNSANKSHPVGQKKPNDLGLYDMSGNVAEFVSDHYDAKYYLSSPKNNPGGPAEGRSTVVRGGSFASKPDELSLSRRDYMDDGRSEYRTGFRLAIPATAINEGTVKYGTNAEQPVFLLKNIRKCLGINKGVREIQYGECDSSENQLWTIKFKTSYKGTDYYWLNAKPNGYCLEIGAGATTSGAAAAQRPCDDIYKNQMWKIIPRGNDYYLLKARHTDKCLSVDTRRANPEAPAVTQIVQMDCTDADGQFWKLEGFMNQKK